MTSLFWTDTIIMNNLVCYIYLINFSVTLRNCLSSILPSIPGIKAKTGDKVIMKHISAGLMRILRSIHTPAHLSHWWNQWLTLIKPYSSIRLGCIPFSITLSLWSGTMKIEISTYIIGEEEYVLLFTSINFCFVFLNIMPIYKQNPKRICISKQLLFFCINELVYDVLTLKL